MHTSSRAELEAKIVDQAKNALAQNRYHDATKLTALLERLSRNSNERRAIETDFQALTGNIGANASNAGGPAAPQQDLEELTITAGDLRQNLLRLTNPVMAGRLRVGEQLEIELIRANGSSSLRTTIVKERRLQARKEIGDWYREIGIIPGDIVLWERLGQGKFRLSKKV